MILNVNDLIPPDIKLCRSVMAGKYVRSITWHPVSFTPRALLLSGFDSRTDEERQMTDRNLLDLSDHQISGN